MSRIPNPGTRPPAPGIRTPEPDTLVIGILQLELAIDHATSLKDKRRVVRSLKDRLHRHHQVSVAEVDQLDNARTAILGVTLASNDVRHAQSTLDRLLESLHPAKDFVLADHKLEILTGQ